MEELRKKLMEADGEYGVASPEEMEVVEALNPLVDKYGAKQLLLSFGAYFDLPEDFYNIVNALPEGENN